MGSSDLANQLLRRWRWDLDFQLERFWSRGLVKKEPQQDSCRGSSKSSGINLPV